MTTRTAPAAGASRSVPPTASRRSRAARRSRSSTTRARRSPALFALALALLLRAAWRRRADVAGWVAPAGWATLALLVASAWLVPWYAIWLMPLAALGSGSAPARREHRVLRLHDGDRHAARALLALLSDRLNEFDLLAKLAGTAGHGGRPGGRRLRRRRRGRARRRRGVGHVRRRIRGGRPLPARDHVDARPGTQVPGGLAVRHRRDGRPAGEAYLAVGLPEHLGEREMLELADGAQALAQRARRHDLRWRPDPCRRAVRGGDRRRVTRTTRTRSSRVAARRRATWSASPERWAARAPACSCWSASRPGSTWRRERGCSNAICARVRCWMPGVRWRRPE